MAGYLTYDVCDELLEELLGRTTESRHKSGRVLGLSRLPANRLGIVLEPDDPDYRRSILLDFGESFLPASWGYTVNLQPIRFPRPSKSWGLIRSGFIATLSGKILLTVDLGVPREVDPLDKPDTYPTILPGELRLGVG